MGQIGMEAHSLHSGTDRTRGAFPHVKNMQNFAEITVAGRVVNASPVTASATHDSRATSAAVLPCAHGGGFYSHSPRSARSEAALPLTARDTAAPTASPVAGRSYSARSHR